MLSYYFTKEAKFYEISLTRGLLGYWEVSRRFGRSGTRGRIMNDPFNVYSDALKHIKALTAHRIEKRSYILQSTYQSPIETFYQASLKDTTYDR